MSFRSNMNSTRERLLATPPADRNEKWGEAYAMAVAAAGLYSEGRKAKAGVVLQRAMRKLQPAGSAA